MFELALHILDLVQNSIRAGATLVTVEIMVNHREDTLTIRIIDDGCGMDAELLARVTSPFATTRTTRKVGLGIPMLKQCAEMCGGTFDLASEPGVGTTLTATFVDSHVDRPPLGDIPATMQALILGSPDVPDFVLCYVADGHESMFDTREVRQALGGVPLSEPAVLQWISDAISEGMAEVDQLAGQDPEPS